MTIRFLRRKFRANFSEPHITVKKFFSMPKAKGRREKAVLLLALLRERKMADFSTKQRILLTAVLAATI